MDENDESLPAPGVSKRRKIVRATLSAALSEQERRDAEAPPASLLTTMGAVRLLGDLILDRHGRGWTDPMLVVLLRELGVEISPETLRVYRGRLKKERGGGVAAAPDTPATAAPAKQAQSAPPATMHDEAVRGEATPSATAAASTTARPAPSKNDGDQLPFDRSIPFDDRV